MRSRVQFSLSLHLRLSKKGNLFYFIMFYIYILYSHTIDRYYVGTQNIENRILRHNNSSTKSTKNGKPWVLVYQESFNTRAEAVKRELEIKKKKSRIYIQNLIDNSID